MWHRHSPSRVVPLVISTACVPTKGTLQPARNASSPAVQSKKLCVRSDSVVVLYPLPILIPPPVAQRWQQKACKAPYRNTGPITQRVGIALVTLAGICVALRFVARWQIKDSTLGWDDWTILASFILLIPSTIKLADSMSLCLIARWSTILTCHF